jgi:hypothetical protein
LAQGKVPIELAGVTVVNEGIEWHCYLDKHAHPIFMVNNTYIWSSVSYSVKLILVLDTKAGRFYNAVFQDCCSSIGFRYRSCYDVKNPVVALLNGVFVEPTSIKNMTQRIGEEPTPNTMSGIARWVIHMQYGVALN